MANHLDRMVSTLGRNPLKVLVQVNTSGEACRHSFIKIIVYSDSLLCILNLQVSVLLKFGEFVFTRKTCILALRNDLFIYGPLTVFGAVP